MAKFQLGGHEVKMGTGGEAVNELDQNKTLIVTNLTADEPLKPEFHNDLKTIGDVFERYKPNVDVEFQDEDGSPISNNLQFRSVGDFGKKGLVKNSDFLQDLDAQKGEFQKFIKMLKIKQMNNIINDPEAKQSYINALQAMIDELAESGA